MDTEIEAYENLEEILKQELEEKNFNIAPAAKFPEEKFKPAAGKHALLAAFYLTVLIFSLVAVYLFSGETSQLLTDYLNRFVEIEQWQAQLVLVLVAALLLLRFPSARLLAHAKIFYLLSRTEYLLSTFYLMLKTKTLRVRTRFVPYDSISDIIVRQRFLDRLMNTGDIVILLKNRKSLTLHAVRQPNEIADKILERLRK